MVTTLFAFGLMLLIVLGMALGVIFGRQPIKGSCGGMGALGIDAECEICGGNPTRCDASRSGRRQRRQTICRLMQAHGRLPIPAPSPVADPSKPQLWRA